MNITRRDFLNGMAVAVVAGMSPLQLLYGKDAKNISHKLLTKDDYYPPKLIGLRGSTNESYEFAHALRDGDEFDFKNLNIEEKYDLVVVGAGISGLAAACVYQDKMGNKKKVLILDNHDDFGGHARRNEFYINDKMILSYGGSESLQSPKALYSKEVVEFLGKLGINIDELAKKFDVNFYPDLNLSRGVYFNKNDFGEDKVVSGNPRKVICDDIPEDRINGRTYKDFIADFPMSINDKKDLINLFENPKDYLDGMNEQQRIEYVNKTSYRNFLRDKVKLSSKAIYFFEGMTDDFLALGISSISCEDARISFLPGFDNLKLPPLDEEAQAEVNEPYIYHFPDGNATIARAMVKRLIPQVANAKNIEELVLAKFDYSKLDMSNSTTKIRLNSTVINVENTKNGALVTYISMIDKKLHKIFAKKVIMANYNSSIPYIIPTMQKIQKESLAKCVKTPLIHTKVIIRNWQPFIKLGVHEIYSPRMFYARTKLDYPVDIGSYKHPRNPKEPICVHMVGSPMMLNRDFADGDEFDAREISRLARHSLFALSFSDLETMIREQLQGMLGKAGFNHQKDILAITLNRWGHCYAYTFNSLYDDEKESEKIIAQAKKPFGNITIANSDSNWDAYAHTAIEEAMRAVKEL
ncbi:NAD(P)/FAD-dependent oxidoreductase [Helicobacter muridarum]|uniref:NAD(P)/FAD-dependent oxidoreductase n=1 Tax=Helicobacter muridarum TaxID=216 RepID=A0A099TXP9_9HELI|nr:NAD(P)/FAD-dependent oxidoreductase [Helicobacter muridarum]TLD98393.1 NAD(P)/FAD-dependent oxidoreductase [Helicobacter muridarum]STQ85803.1 Protoporphyrinogen oxidase [Helicobacter muridarum]